MSYNKQYGYLFTGNMNNELKVIENYGYGIKVTLYNNVFGAWKGVA